MTEPTTAPATAPPAVADQEAERGSSAGEPTPLRYRRVLLKLSGEALLGDRQYGVDPAFCAFIAMQVAEIHRPLHDFPTDTHCGAFDLDAIVRSW